MVDAQLSTRLEDSIQKAFWLYTVEFKKKAQGEKKRYIDLIKKLVKDIIKDERDREDKDKDEDPHAESDQVLKRRMTSNDVEPSKGSKSKESKSSTSKGTKSKPKSSSKSAQAEESVFKVADTDMPHNQGSNLGNTNDQPNVEDAPKSNCRMILEYNFKECYKALTDQLDWNNPECKEYSFYLSKPLPLIEDRVIYVKVMKWYDYGYLEEIEVQREDQNLYKFKEAGGRPSTRSRKLPGEAKNHQAKKFKSDISNRTPYTAYNNPQGIIYVDKYKRNRFMRSDELYKFSDGTLTSVRSVLHDITSNLRMDYFPKTRWSNLDKQRSHIMIKAIDKLQLERRLMRNLEKFVGGRDYWEDFRLLERTI
nr:hypothetical protein [Tanacetum cinerariifolium]